MRIPVLLLLLLSSAVVHASDADTAWAVVEELRQGPGKPAADAPEEVVKSMRAHLGAQERVLAEFITRHPDDPRRYEAELEYAGVLATLGASLTDRSRVEKSLQRLAALERSKSAPSDVRADAAFQRITTTMQTINLAAAERPGETARARNTILESAQNFAATYPEDRRAARLLAEAATLLDDQPVRKERTLEQARGLARDEATKQRINDDLTRLGLLGETMDLSFDTLRDGRWSLADQRGRVTVLVFWAGWSPPSVAWLAEFGRFARDLPGGSVAIATVSLDKKKGNAVETLSKLGIPGWPTACSGTGWEDPLVRRLGINALPTVFIFDKQGRLRTLNARQGYESLIRQLVAEKK
ncbi:MAG: TlpA family protein disulfide reductase [Chthoniobacterales bacterium]